jgi:peptidoglycan/xylan/chitin deacetylase (PgdA/CDA1 family)
MLWPQRFILKNSLLTHQPVTVIFKSHTALKQTIHLNSILPILTFHSIDHARDVLSFAPEIFRRGIAALAQLGYRTISLSDAVDCLRRGADFPTRSCAITFDDGYASTFTDAFPVLQQFNFTATIFLTVGDGNAARLPSLHRRAMLSWDEIRKMQNQGITFGAHTLTHPDLTRLPAETIDREMRASKQIIEQTIGEAVTTFAYPFGKFNLLCRDIASRYFDCAVSDQLGLVRAHSDPFALDRVETYYLQNEKLFALLPTRWFELYLRIIRISRDLRRRIS